MIFQSLSDARLVRRVLSGRPEAFEMLVFRYQKKAYAIAHALGVPPSSLDDAVQEAFFQAYRDLARLADPAKFGPWLAQIVRNASRKLTAPAGTTMNSWISTEPRACLPPLRIFKRGTGRRAGGWPRP